MRLIDADELKQAIHNSNLSGNREWLLMDLDKIINNAPTVELRMGRMTNGVIIPIERPQGEWIRLSNRLYKCKNCGYISDYKYPFCHCGADMRGKKNEDT